MRKIYLFNSLNLFINFFLKKNIFKNKIYLNASHIIDDYRKENKSINKLISFDEEQKISSNSMRKLLNSLGNINQKLKGNFWLNSLYKKYNDEKIYFAANMYLFPYFFDNIRESEVKKYFLKKKINLVKKKLKFIDFFLTLIKSYLIFFKFVFQFNPKIKKINKKYFDYGIHLNNRLGQKNISNKFLDTLEDSNLIESIKKKGKTAIVKSQWQINDLGTKNYIKKNKLVVVDDFNIEISIIPYLKIILKEFFILTKEIIFSIICRNLDQIFLTYLRIKYDLIKCSEFYEKNIIKNFISRDDFNPIHISRTLIAKKKKLIHTGIGHSNFLHPLTSFHIHFKCFNNLIINSREIYKIYKKTWISKKHTQIGYLYGSNILKNSKNKNLIKKIKNKFNNRRFFLLLLSTFNSNNPFDTYEINQKNLQNIFNLLQFDNNFILVIKTRHKDNLIKLIKSLNNYDRYKDRIIIDLDTFTAHQLVPFADFVITSATSSSIFETLYINKPIVLPINVRGIKNLMWNKIDKRIKIFNNSDELIKFFPYLMKKKNKRNYKNKYNKIIESFCNYKKDSVKEITKNI